MSQLIGIIIVVLIIVAVVSLFIRLYNKLIMLKFNVDKSFANIDVLLKLQERVSQLEDNIADRREFFNESVNMYNIGINEFPSLLLSKPIMGYKEKLLLQITELEKSYSGVKF